MGQRLNYNKATIELVITLAIRKSNQNNDLKKLVSSFVNDNLGWVFTKLLTIIKLSFKFKNGNSKY